MVTAGAVPTEHGFGGTAENAHTVVGVSSPLSENEGMSHAVSPDELYATALPYGTTPFLLYTGSSGAPRAIHVVAELTPDSSRVVVRGFGRGLTKTLTDETVLSLLWPQHGEGEFSLIADAHGVIAEGADGDELVLTVTGAVLHRPAPVDGDGSC